LSCIDLTTKNNFQILMYVFSLCIHKLRYFIILPIIFFSCLSLFLGSSDILALLCQYLLNIIFLIIGFTIHEFFHLFFLKFYGVKVCKIVNGSYRFSIFPLEKIDRAIESIIVALSGPFLTSVIGSATFLLMKNIHILSSYKYLSFYLILHIIFIFPFFGDGRIILKNLTKL